MKKCSECDIEMIEDTDLHTDFVGGVKFEEQIYLTYLSNTTMSKNIFGQDKERKNYLTERVKSRVCPICGKVELYIDINGTIKK